MSMVLTEKIRLTPRAIRQLMEERITSPLYIRWSMETSGWNLIEDDLFVTGNFGSKALTTSHRCRNSL